MARACTKCKVEEPVATFYKGRPECKACSAIRERAYRAANREKVNTYHREYMAKRPQAKEERAAQYAKHRDQILAKKRVYYRANKEKRQQYNKEYLQKNREKLYAYNRDYHAANKDNVYYILPKRLRNRLTAAIRSLAKTGSAVRDLGCSIEELKHYLELRFTGEMTWANHGSVWHIDHIRPLASFDLENRDELLIACHYTNLQPLLAKDNISKGAKWQEL